MLFLCRGGCISRHGGLLSAKSVCACSGETLLGTSLGKTYLSIVLKATSLYDHAEGTGAKEEGHESTGAHEGALQGMLNAAQTNLLDMGEAVPGHSCLMAFQPGVHASMGPGLLASWLCLPCECPWVEHSEPLVCLIFPYRLPKGPIGIVGCSSITVGGDAACCGPTSPTPAMGVSWTQRAGATDLCALFS